MSEQRGPGDGGQKKEVYRKEPPGPGQEADMHTAAVAQARRAARRKNVMEWVWSFVIALAVALFITQVIIVNARIPSESMEETIHVGDRVIGFRLSYLFDSPERGDIVIFKYPDDEKELYVKRIVGMPGDTVMIQGGLVYINGAAQPLDEPYVLGEPVGDYGPYVVPEGSYFVMGDNRQNSWDSRFWNNTFVQEEKIKAKAVWRIFPDPTVLA